MTDRDRLIRLIQEAEDEYMVYEMVNQALPIGVFKSREEYIADYLIANGVIVPPCKIGQIVWLIRNGKIEETTVEKIVLKDGGLYLKLLCNAFYETTCRSIGKTVFLTREEAEKALERSKNNA